MKDRKNLKISEILQYTEPLGMPGQDFLKEFGINTTSPGVALPAKEFRLIKPFQGPLQIRWQYTGLPFVSESLQEVNKSEELARFSQAAAVVDILGSGIYPQRNIHLLSRYLLAKGVFDLNSVNRPSSNIQDPRELIKHTERAVEKFVETFPTFADRLGLDTERLKVVLFDSVILEEAILSGRDKLSEEIIAQNPRTLTMLLGSKAAWMLSGRMPDSFSLQYFITLISRRNEFAPQILDPTDPLARNELGNVMGLAMDIYTSRAFPKSFALANRLQEYKVGENDYYWRSYLVGNSPKTLELLRLRSIPPELITNAYVERGLKSTTAMIRKSTSSMRETLFNIYKERKPLVSIASFPVETLSFTGFEALLETYYPELDEVLLQEILQKMVDIGDDIRVRFSPKEELFDETVREMMGKSDAVTDIVADGYDGSGTKIDLDKPNLEDIINGTSPHEGFRIMWKKLRDVVGEEGKLYLAIRYRRFVNNNGLGISLHLTPQDDSIQIKNWATRTAYTKNI